MFGPRPGCRDTPCPGTGCPTDAVLGGRPRPVRRARAGRCQPRALGNGMGPCRVQRVGGSGKGLAAGRGQAAHDGGGDPFPRLEELSLGYLGTPWREAQLLEGQPPTGAGAASGCLWHPGNVYLLTSPSSLHDLRSFTAQTGALGLSDLQGSRQPGSDRRFPSAR